VRNDPTNSIDPTGHKEEIQKIKGNQYGDWIISQDNESDPGVKPYSSHVTIKFEPNKDTVCSDEIAFIQIARITDQGNTLSKDGTPVEGKSLVDKAEFRRTKTGWFLDRLPDKYGWFGYGDDGKPIDRGGSNVIPGSSPKPYKVAEMLDTPGDDNGRSYLRWEFETYAIAKSGRDAGKIYGGIYWGFDVGDLRKMTSLPPGFFDAPTPEFEACVALWDKQAKGAKHRRTTPDQHPFGSSIDFGRSPLLPQMPGLWWRYQWMLDGMGDYRSLQ
jgi:hypothetical protein